MTSKCNNNPAKKDSSRGIVLITVLVLLTILSALAYTLTSRVMIQRGREQYMIDYQTARYACDSAVKYAIATLGDISDPAPVARPGVPDFSDLFTLDEIQYRQLLSDWADSITEEQAQKYAKKTSYFGSDTDINDLNDISDIESIFADMDTPYDLNDPNSFQIPGPYGPQWPFITEPISLDIGNASVRIEIHDENAKYPIGWLMLDDPGLQPQILAGFENLCEWTDVNDFVVEQVEEELKELNKIKEYKTEFKETKITKRVKVAVPSRAKARSSRSRSKRTRYKTETKVTKIPASLHLTDFARLYHSSMLETESLARPYFISKNRKESPLKYISLWPISKININSAPRHVLEAAFAFAGLSDSVKIAQEVIEKRQIKPFKDTDDLRNQLYGYSDSIEKCRQYIVTKSDFFTIRITTNSGQAKASAVIAVKKNKNKMEKIAVLNG